MNKNETFSYWKKPYQKWLVLFGTFLVLISLYFRIQDFINISNLETRNDLFSQSGWEKYLMQQYFGFAIYGIIMGILVGCFIIGCVAKSNKSARKSEVFLLISLGVLWCIFGVSIGIWIDTIALIFWAILAIAILAYGVYSFFKARRL